MKLHINGYLWQEDVLNSCQPPASPSWGNTNNLQQQQQQLISAEISSAARSFVSCQQQLLIQQISRCIPGETA